MFRSRTVTSCVLAASLLVPAAGAYAIARDDQQSEAMFQAAAAANPDTGRPYARDVTVRVQPVHGWRHWEANAVAQASSVCSGCRAEAGVVQILTSNQARSAGADNAAVAWNQCASECSSRAVSIQVIVSGSMTGIRASNRAFAANVGCATCKTSAVAYQIIVIGPRTELSERGRSLVQQAERALLQAIPAGTGGSVTSHAKSAAKDPVAEQLRRDLLGSEGARTVEVRSQVRSS